MIVILSDSELSWRQRYARYYPDGLSMPADLWVCTAAEWSALPNRSPQLSARLKRELLELT